MRAQLRRGLVRIAQEKTRIPELIWDHASNISVMVPRAARAARRFQNQGYTIRKPPTIAIAIEVERPAMLNIAI